MLGDLKVDLTERTVRLREKNVQLTPTEYSLFKAFVVHANRLLTHRQLVPVRFGAALTTRTPAICCE